ncbi:glycosyl transferase [Aureococcus anophagefferens]|uniref:Glycosyl transferase n=1 Tax=Aureococcus anophagefferens TaxID=44056 RepID=A0ABR1FVF7_AURAN
MDPDRANRFVVSSKRGALMRQGASLDAPPREGFDVGAAPAGVAAPVTEAATIPAGTVVAVGELRALASGKLFDKLAARCGGRLELTCALLPGRHQRHKEDVVGDLGALAAALADYLPLEESLAPYALLGVSIGALVAWALAKDSVLWP